jgi:hypothetical protein
MPVINIQGRASKRARVIAKESAARGAKVSWPAKSVTVDGMTVKQWLAVRKKAGREIDPKTAEVLWTYAQTLDPYGVDRELPAELQQIGRECFARSPGSDVWVWFGDLPEPTRDALWEKHGKTLAFPAGLF